MKRIFCGFLATVIAVMLLSSCKITEKTNLILPEEGKADEAEAVVFSDTIRLALNHAKSLNPYDEQDAANLQAFRLVYEPLFDYDSNMRAVPVLAESWTVSEDGQAITVKLKDGVKFHNGKTLTSNDVINTVSLILAGDTAYSEGVIERAQIIDKRTVLIRFFTKQMNAEEKLMFPIIEKNSSGIMGTGPYKLDGKESTDVYGFSRFPEYHGVMPQISFVKMINTPDIDSVVRLFDIGETDILTSDAFDYATFKVGAEMSVYDYPINSMVYMGVNFDNSIFWGESTRQALMYVINKEEIIEKAMYQKAVEADFPINPSSWLYPKELEYKKDNVRAEELLAQDSWTRSDGVYARMIDGKRQNFKINMLVLEDSKMQAVADIIENAFDNFGIDCHVVVKGEEEFSQSISNKEYDVFLGSTELSGSADFERLTGAGNVFGYLNSNLDTITGQIRTERDETALKQKYAECCGIFLKDVQFIPLFFYKEAVVVGKNISKNVVPGLYNPFYNIAEWNR